MDSSLPFYTLGKLCDKVNTSFPSFAVFVECCNSPAVRVPALLQPCVPAVCVSGGADFEPDHGESLLLTPHSLFRNEAILFAYILFLSSVS